MSMFPKGSSKSSSPKPPPVDSLVGSFVQYEDEGSVILGVVTAPKKDRYLILNLRGREVELGRGRLYQLPGREGNAAGSTSARVAELSALHAKIEEQAEAFDVAELWSFVHEDVRTYSVQELNEAYFGNNDLITHAGLRVALIREKVHFKRDKDDFEPRSVEVVEELERAEEAKRKKLAVRDATVSFIDLRLKEPGAPIPREIDDNMRLMAEVAAGVTHSDPARQKEGKQLVRLCAEKLDIPENLPIEKQAFDALVRLGVFRRDANLSFIRNEIPVAHKLEVLEEARHVPRAREVDDFEPHVREGRVDLTRKDTFTIDDESTKDMDDALSLEQTPAGYELGIHITDVTWAVLPETHLDQAARRRATSIYCADQTVNMFPEELSEERLSLCEGAVRPCLSVILQLSTSYEVISSRIIPSFIRSHHRYSYDDVDRLLEEGDATLLTVHEIAAACEERRLRKGAVKVHRREVVPFLEDDGSIRLLEIEEESPARSLVAEMMVLANSVLAEFAAQHRIPVLFRGQERPDDEAERDDTKSVAPEGPAKDYSARTKLKKSTVSFEPQHHSGLGLDAYIQASSPIRRYMDLCHQRQFLSFLRTEKPWISREQFEAIAFEVENYLQSANVVSRETKRYWLLRYLEQRGKKVPIEGTVVRTDTKTPLVELDEVYLTVFFRPHKPVKLGQRLTLRVSAVDPHADYIRLDEV
jgi:exoribonuclease-2